MRSFNPKVHQDSKLHIGASWYPEMWPEQEWPKDVSRMKELGFNITRMFEFAWHRFEPEEGKYSFDWALKVMDLCHEAGVAVMIGTPTAAPPAWLTSKYPEVLQTDSNGKRATHGKRKHYNHHSPKYRELSRSIVEKMAEVFSKHPALHSWQIDNEMSGYDYGDETRKLFHEWLSRKFGSVENMNKTWGLEFWSQAYPDFSQVPLVAASVGSVEIPERNHPSLILALAKFQNDGWTHFISEQCDVIRNFSDKPITSNMTPGMAMHWFQHNKVLDRVGHSLYRDVEHYQWNLQFFDRMRAEKHVPYWLLETAPSWSAGGRMWNIHHDEKGIQAMTWMSNFLGGTMAIYWQWREHWAGQEMQHGTHVTATGKWRPNKEAMQKLSGEFRQHGQWLLDNPPEQARVAILLSNEASWAFSIDPIDDNMRYEVRWRDDFYLPLCRNHIWRDVIDETHDLSPYRVLMIPMVPVLSREFRQKLDEWVQAGGYLILGPLTGYRNEEFTVFLDQEFGGLEKLMGAESSLRFTVHWVEKQVRIDCGKDGEFHTRNWCEGFKPTRARIRAHYRGGYGDGHAAILENSHGKGKVLTLGCAPSEEFWLKFVNEALDTTQISKVATGSGSVLVVPRKGKAQGYGVVNLTEQPQAITLPFEGTDLLTGRTIKPDLELQPMEILLVQKNIS